MLAETLEDRGFEVITAANGLEAIDLVRSMAAPPSIILLDLMMPVMDGYGFLEERKKDAALASIPVAIITAGHGMDTSQLGTPRRSSRNRSIIRNSSASSELRAGAANEIGEAPRDGAKSRFRRHGPRTKEIFDEIEALRALRRAALPAPRGERQGLRDLHARSGGPRGDVERGRPG